MGLLDRSASPRRGEIIAAWKKPSEELSRFLEERMAPFDVKKKKMFGCPVYFANDNMISGVFENDIFMGRVMKEYNEKHLKLIEFFDTGNYLM